jgi:hypothetical protein
MTDIVSGDQRLAGKKAKKEDNRQVKCPEQGTVGQLQNS